MSSRALLNLALASIAVILGLVIVYQPGLEKPAGPQPITARPVDSISSIQLTRSTRDPLTFTKSADQWRLTGTHDLPADKFQVNTLLAILQAHSTRNYPADTLDLATLGLAPPQASLRLDDTLVHIGNTESLDNNRYVQIGETVFLVADKYPHLINASWTNFVDRKLLPPNAALRKLQLPDVTLTFTPAQQWEHLPDNPDTGADAMQALVDNWQRARATYIRRYTGSGTAATITLDFSDETATITLHIVAHPTDFILARPDRGIQYHLSGGMRDSLLVIEKQEQKTGVETDQHSQE